MSSVEERKEITDFWYSFIENCIDTFKSPLKLSRTNDETFELVKEGGNIKFEGPYEKPNFPYVWVYHDREPDVEYDDKAVLKYIGKHSTQYLPIRLMIESIYSIDEIYRLLPKDDETYQTLINDDWIDLNIRMADELWLLVDPVNYFDGIYTAYSSSFDQYPKWFPSIEFYMKERSYGCEYDPLKDPKLKANPPEEFKQLNDLQPKHLTKVGSFYHIQNAWMQRFFATCSEEMRPFVFTFYDFKEAGNEPFHSYSLNIYPSCSGKSRKYNMWRIKEERWNEFKTFMSQDIKPSEIKSSHQGCYLLQLNCDEGSNKYKIGKAQNLLNRLKSTEYRNAFIYSTQFVQDEDACEREIIREFSSKFELIKHDTKGGYGSEMFAGDIKAMIKLFQEICNKFI